MNITQEIQNMERLIRETENAKLIYENQLENCRKQYQANEQELQKLGIDPKNAQAELQTLADLIKKEVAELKALLSPNLIQELQEELNRPIETDQSTVDYGLEF